MSVIEIIIWGAFGLTVSFMILYKSWYWICVMPFFLIFTHVEIGGHKIGPENFFILISAPGIILNILMHAIKGLKKKSINFKLKWIFLTFVCSLFLTECIHSGFHLENLKYGTNYLVKGILVFLVVKFIDDNKKLEMCLKSLLFVFFMITALAFIEMLMAKNFFLFRNVKGVLAFSVSQYTFLVNPNLLARAIVILFPLVIFGAFYLQGNQFLRTWFCLAISGSFVLIVSTLSRAGIAAYSIEALFVVWFFRKSIPKKYFYHIPATIGGCCIFLIMFWQSLYVRFMDMVAILRSPIGAMTVWDMKRRMRAWIGCMEIIKENPIVGVGLKNMEDHLFAHNATKIVGDDIVAVTPHGTFLFFLVIGGIVVAIPLLLLLSNYIKFLLKKQKYITGRHYKFLVYMGLAMITGVLVCSIAANPLHLGILWFSVGMILSGVNILSKERGITKVQGV